MRVWALLFLAAVAGAQDLRPREGSGWAGFKVGSWVRMKRTAIVTGGVPKVIIWKQNLTKVGAKLLTVETVSRNALGMERKDSQQLPRAGEAGPGETQKVEKLKNEVVVAVGKRLDCTRRRITVTGRRGKRVVTVWTATRPQISAKRSEVHYDAAGKVVYRVTRLLSSLNVSREVGSRKVRCVEYKTRLVHQNGDVVTGVALTSRDVPGGLVWMEEETSRRSEKVLTMRVEMLAFLAK
jgi:hypothetical protein